ncbi:hypothetical protein MA16_Dca018724 [Dendrobium catenatum]|uniref:Putative plant transposon protein domain-containing protein n=1 Tax=Dendrobium catenatum TaxID=906689 RepID=A0A2I0VUZ9_9ASPA|nr:hypothetical protein MA16_Dca018724 [Dendrobium catenatum]
MVREFFVNEKEAIDNQCCVRDKWVPFNFVAVNHLYKLRDFKFDEYTAFTLEPINSDVLLRVLCKPYNGTMWKKRKDKIIKFPTSYLTQLSKVWHYFISTHLLPSKKKGEVTKEQAMLNYAIQVGYTIDVEKHIYYSLNYIIRGITSVGLGHPSLIHALCVNADVRGDLSEDIFSISTLTKRKIESFKRLGVEEGGPIEPRLINRPSSRSYRTPKSLGE